MNILHVSMGLPPFRTGGLNRYCVDLINEQVRQGDKVSLVYPGEFIPFLKTRICEEDNEGFRLFRIVNPLPLALTNGINTPKRYMKPCVNPKVYKDFLRKLNPDVVHIHTFQGFHKELFQAAYELSIKMVYTTHDYYPFCSGCVLLDHEGKQCEGACSADCATCNFGRGLSKTQEYVMQSRLYQLLKYSSVITRLRKKNVAKIGQKRNRAKDKKSLNNDDYRELFNYYMKILECMNVIHCNSEATKKVYERYLPSSLYKVQTISHANIRQTKHEFSKDLLRIGFLGGLNRYKGLNVLLDALKELDEREVTYQLILYGADFSELEKSHSKIVNGGFYTEKTAEEIWKTFDVLVVPSQCMETYGFVVLEAIAHGVGVICSDLVGARQMLPPSDIFTHDSPHDLAEKLMQRHAVVDVSEDVFSMEKHAKKIKDHIYL